MARHENKSKDCIYECNNKKEEEKRDEKEKKKKRKKEATVRLYVTV